MGENMNISFLVIIALILLVGIPNTQASFLNATSDAGAWMVMKGAEGFMYLIGDSIYGVVDTVPNERSKTDMLITELLAWNVDPYSFREVRDWQDYCAVAFVVIGISVLMVGFVFMRLDIKSIDSLIDDGYTRNRVIDALLILLAVPLLSVFGVWVLLKINYILSYLIVDYMLMTIPQTSNNFVIYIFAGLAFILLSAVMFIRAIYIVFFTAISIVVGVAYGVTELRQTVTDYVYSFIKIVFLQPKLLLILVIGIIVIEKIPLVLINLKPLAYLSLVLYIGYVGYKAVTGNMITNIVKVAIFKKV